MIHQYHCLFVLFWIVYATVLPFVTGQEIQCTKSNRVQLIPHERFCDYYYRCDGEQLIEEKCPNGLAFAGHRRGMIEHCSYPYEVGCPDGIRVMGQSPLSTGNCPWSYGVFAHETSCTRYWQCWNGTGILQQCPYSLLYNEQIHSCDWPQNVPDCQKHPLCTDKPNGAVAIEDSCNNYWLCVGGYPRLQRCPAGLAFNIELSKCDFDYTVPGCEPIVDSNDIANNKTNDADHDLRGA